MQQAVRPLDKTHLRSLVRPGVKTGVMDALIAVLAHQQVLLLLALVRALVTHDAGLAVVAGPAVLLKPADELRTVDPAAGVDRLTALVCKKLQ